LNQFKEIPLAGSIFYVRKFEPLKALQILGDLQKMLFGPMAAAMASRSGGVEVQPGANLADAMATVSNSQADAAFGEALLKLSERLSGEQLRKLAEMLLNPDYVSVKIQGQGEAVKLNEGAVNLSLPDVTDLILLCGEVVKHNYSSFGTRVRDLIGRVPSIRGLIQ